MRGHGRGAAHGEADALLAVATMACPMPPFPWSLAEIQSQLRAGELSPRQVLRASEEAIRTQEPRIRAWSWLGLSEARARARRSEAAAGSEGTSPLLGVPYAVKDIFDTAGSPTEWGTETQRGRVPDRDCDLVAKLNSLGAVLVGKTHTTAYAYYDPGPTRNPRDLGRTPGGSSSGSAAAVAAGMVPLAVGSQTQGSVLRPASFCGIAGFKPSYGLLPLGGVMRFAPTLDHAGLLAATAADLRVAWRALGFETGSDPSGVAVLDWPPGERVEPSMAAAFRAAAQSLAAAGLPLTFATRPAFFETLPAALRTVMAREAATEHGDRYRRFGRRIGAQLAALLEEGLEIGEERYRAARRVLLRCRDAFAEWAVRHPVVATPAAPGPAPRGLGSTGDPRCNAPFTALGAPAISIPLPTAPGGEPMGLQLAAAPGGDAGLLATAALCEALLARSG